MVSYYSINVYNILAMKYVFLIVQILIMPLSISAQHKTEFTRQDTIEFLYKSGKYLFAANSAEFIKVSFDLDSLRALYHISDEELKSIESDIKSNAKLTIGQLHDNDELIFKCYYEIDRPEFSFGPKLKLDLNAYDIASENTTLTIDKLNVGVGSGTQRLDGKISSRSISKFFKIENYDSLDNKYIGSANFEFQFSKDIEYKIVSKENIGDTINMNNRSLVLHKIVENAAHFKILKDSDKSHLQVKNLSDDAKYELKRDRNGSSTKKIWSDSFLYSIFENNQDISLEEFTQKISKSNLDKINTESEYLIIRIDTPIQNLFLFEILYGEKHPLKLFLNSL